MTILKLKCITTKLDGFDELVELDVGQVYTVEVLDSQADWNRTQCVVIVEGRPMRVLGGHFENPRKP